MLARLRAAMTPQVLAVLALTLLLFGMLSSAGNTGDAASALEARISKALSAMEGAGEVQVVIMTREEDMPSGVSVFATQTQQKEMVPCGAVAVAQGADDPLVRMELTQALCALLNLPASSVSVMSGGK